MKGERRKNRIRYASHMRLGRILSGKVKKKKKKKKRKEERKRKEKDKEEVKNANL